MTGLPILLKGDGLSVMLLGEGEAADAKRRLLERCGATVVGINGDARLAVVAIEDEAAAVTAVAALRARGLLINAVDRPALCDFTLPAIVDRSPLLVAVSTGGVSAGLAAAVRQAIEALLPATLGGLTTQLHAARAGLRQRFADGGARRRALGDALAAGGALDPMTSQPDDAVERWLAAAAVPSDRVERIVLRSGNPDDLTIGQARLLAQADRVHHPADAPPAILARARADAVRIVGSAPGGGAGLSVEIAGTW